ncbi:MAG: PilZ domain-containing protein [Armatimonadetes bacterium]|nr:PilZ domain-containing protein [Armatimonadota bacterium]
MFGLRRTPAAQFIGLKERKLTFVSRDWLKVGKQERIRLALPRALSQEEVLLRVWIGAARPLECGGYAYTGEMAPGFALPALEGVDAVAADSALRGTPRYPCSLVLRSRGLPAGRAVTLDLSTGGLQICTSSEIQPGAVLDLELSLEEVTHPCTARVAWCSGNRREGYRAGLQFQNLPEPTRQALERASSRLAGGETLRSDPALPSLRRSDAGLGTIEHYQLSSRELLVKLRQGEEHRDYRFIGCCGLMDLYGAVGRRVHGLRDTASPGRRRYHFLDQDGNVLLEVVALRLEASA